jgi:predicted DNA-binding transcriptional regulator AlpA
MEEKEWLTYEEAMEVLGVKRSTLFTLITAENITPKKFKYNRHRYLAQSDVKRLKELSEKPWSVSV